MEGIVKWYDYDNGIGFSTVKDTPEDVLIHFSELVNVGMLFKLSEGDLIEFELGEYKGKPKAKKIIVKEARYLK